VNKWVAKIKFYLGRFEWYLLLFILFFFNSFAHDVEKPGVPYGIKSSNKTPTSIILDWEGPEGNVGVAEYWVEVRNFSLDQNIGYKRIVVSEKSPEFASTSIELDGLVPLANYEVRVIAKDAAGNSPDAGTVAKGANSIRFNL